MEKRNLIIYWIATVLLAFGMLGSGLQQLLHLKDMMDLMQPLGYPSYFFTIIGIWKIIGTIVILIPNFKLLKEWAYAGFFFVMTGAFFSHLTVGNGIMELVPPIMQTIFIVISWYFRPANRKI